MTFRPKLAPLYAAGFTTAFGAHSIAAGLGAEHESLGLGFLSFGIILAIYDVAEVVLKPVFGSLADKIGAKPVILGGLVLFAVFSLLGALTASSILSLALVRLGQGAAASAFSPASSAAIARLAGPSLTGTYFGRYGSWKTLGYVAGPLIGAALIHFGGFALLFAFMTILSTAISLWVAFSLPALSVLPKARTTLLDLTREITKPSFLVPTSALACVTAALGVAVGFLPLAGSTLNLSTLSSMSLVSALALCSAGIQPWAGKLHDAQKLRPEIGLGLGLLLTSLGLIVVGHAPNPLWLFAAAILLGCGIGIATPVGFSYLARTTQPEHMGRTMGSAELGREVGDAAGPILVGALSAAVSLTAGLWLLAILVACCALISWTALRPAAQRNS